MSMGIRMQTEYGLSLVVVAPVLHDAQPQKPVEDKRDGDHGTVVVIGSGRQQFGGCNRRPNAPNHHGGACVSPDPRDFFPDESAPNEVVSTPGKSASK